MLILQGVHYMHPNGDVQFSGIDLIIHQQDKVALIGNNGTGKSTLLKIMAGLYVPNAGVVKADGQPYYVPQVFGQFNQYTIAQALGVQHKINALQAILAGALNDVHLSQLNDDWTIEERCHEALAYWNLADLTLDQGLATLSGGQKTRVFLAGIMIHKPTLVLLDEPTNHMDQAGRQKLYAYLRSTKNTVLVVSHDKQLLNLLDKVYALGKNGISVYGGNYDFYAAQKAVENETLQHELKSKEKALRKAKETEREALERQQKLDARGKRKQEKAGMPTIVMNGLRNKAEQSTSRLKTVHDEKVGTIAHSLSQLRQALPAIDRMKIDLDQSKLPKGKVLFDAKGINYGYRKALLWPKGLDFEIRSGDRICLKGLNGSGKTTLIQLLLGKLDPQEGTLYRAAISWVYIDQDYSLIDPELDVYAQAQQYNTHGLLEHEIKMRLNRFLFTKADWDKPCQALSGGERMRLMLCMLTISNQTPALIVLDEPTNNLDRQNIDMLTAAINTYAGTLLVVSHDMDFLEEIHVTQSIIIP